MHLRWLTSARAKSLSVLLPAVGSAIAIVIAAAKPSGAKSAENGYVLLRDEVMYLREDNRKMRKTLEDMQAWMKDWQEYDDEREKVLLKKDTSNLAQKLNELNDKKAGLRPLPKMEAPPMVKSPPPMASSVF